MPRRPTGAWQLTSLTPPMLSTTKPVSRSYMSVNEMAGRPCMHEQHSPAAIQRAACSFRIAAQCSHASQSLESLRAWLSQQAGTLMSHSESGVCGPHPRQSSWLAIRLLDPARQGVQSQLAAPTFPGLLEQSYCMLPALLQRWRSFGGAPQNGHKQEHGTPLRSRSKGLLPLWPQRSRRQLWHPQWHVLRR